MIKMPVIKLWYILLPILLTCRMTVPEISGNNGQSNSLQPGDTLQPVIPEQTMVPDNSVQLVCTGQTHCLSWFAKTLADTSWPCARVDSLIMDSSSAKICIIGYGYCSSKYDQSVRDFAGTIFLFANDTCPDVSRCSCPVQLCYTVEGIRMPDRKIVYVGSVHPERGNAVCTLSVR